MIERPNLAPAIRKNPATQILELNPYRALVRSWTQGTAIASQVSVAASAQADDAIKVEEEAGLTGDFEITHFTSDHLGAYRLELEVQGGTAAKLMNAPIHVDLICGTGERPYYLSTPIFVEAGALISVRFTNVCNGITNQIRLKAHGRRFLNYQAFATQRQIAEMLFRGKTLPYFSALDDTAVTVAASAVNQAYFMTLPGDADFEAEYLCGKSYGTGRIQILESKSGRPIMMGGGNSGAGNQEIGVEFSHVFGTARNPYRFSPDPAYFKRRTRPCVMLDDLSGVANTIEIALAGRLIYLPDAKRALPA